jgi:hypothetical protein
MGRFAIPLVLSLALALTGCASLEPSSGGSWVEPLAAKDAPRLVAVIGDLIQQRLPPAGATLVIEPPQSGQTDNPIAAQLADALRRKGYALAEPDKAGADAHHLRYLITRRGDGVLLRVVLDRNEASRILARGKSGELESSAPFAIREALRSFQRSGEASR